jgi:hypothetical protein
MTGERKRCIDCKRYRRIEKFAEKKLGKRQDRCNSCRKAFARGWRHRAMMQQFNSLMRFPTPAQCNGAHHDHDE